MPVARRLSRTFLALFRFAGVNTKARCAIPTPGSALMTRRSPPSIAVWSARAGVAFFFLASGWEKLPPSPAASWVKVFVTIGWGNWFLYFTGACEVLGGLLVLIPRFSEIGGGILATVMLGAIVFHTFVLGEAGSSIFNVVLIAVIVFASRKRRKQDDEMTTLELSEPEK